MYPYITLLGRNIGTYGLCMAVAFCLVSWFSYRSGRPRGLLWEDIFIIASSALGGALLCGGALYIVVTYSWQQILSFIRQGDFRFLGSGIVFYGGLAGGIFGSLLGTRLARNRFSVVEYAIVPYIPLGHAVGRMGCVLAGCCHGFPYSGPFALYYPNSVAGLPADQGYFPVQPLESLVNVLICLLLVWYRKRAKRATQLLFAYLGLYAVSRFFLEMLRGDTIRGAWGGISTSQWISLILLTVCLIYLLWNVISSRRNNSASL